MNNNSQAFVLEGKRAQLAIDNKLKNLQRTYDISSPEIVNRNTSALWSKINLIQIKKRENPMAWERVQICANAAKDKKNILDIGFGSGIIEDLIYKDQIKANIFGIDIARQSVRIAQKKMPNADFCVGSILKLPYKNSQFDCVLALEILEHIQPHNTFKALFEVNRVLKKGGCFIVSIPLNEGLENLVKTNTNLNAHVRVYSPELIKAELSIAGFNLIKEHYLYAFHSFYAVKSFIARLTTDKYKPNNIILICRKK